MILCDYVGEGARLIWRMAGMRQLLDCEFTVLRRSTSPSSLFAPLSVSRMVRSRTVCTVLCIES